MTGTDAQIEAIDELRGHFKLSTEELIQFRDSLRCEMDIGLKSENSNMDMLPSWIFKHPTGQETGEYLGLEISGKMMMNNSKILHAKRKCTDVWLCNPP